MTGQDQVNSCLFENREEVLSHLGEDRIGVRVVRSLAVRWMVPESNGPLSCRRREIRSQPGSHRTARGAIGSHRVEADKVNIRVIKRVILLGSRRYAAGFGIR